MPGCAKSRISDMVNNGCVEPAPPARPSEPAEPTTSVPAARPADEPATRDEPTADEKPPTAGEAPDAAAEEPTRLERGEERRPRDMILSLAVLLVPIALLVLFYRLVLSGDAPVTVDPSSTIQEARQAAVFTVLEPRGLPDDWHASSVTFSRQAGGATLRVGYVDPGKDPVQLVESSVPAATLLPAELGSGAKPLGNVRTAAGVWRVYDARPGEKALVLADEKRTVVVVGKTGVESLQAFATTLA
jgi:hypothetical protein